MDIYKYIDSFFKTIQSNFDKIIELLDKDDFKNLLIYLFNCFPPEILAVFFMIILFFAVVFFLDALNKG